MRRHLVFSVVAFTVGCQAITGDFSVGAGGTDSGANGNDDGSAGDSTATDSGSTADSTAADSGSAPDSAETDSGSTADSTAADSGATGDAAAADSGSADSGIVSDGGDAAAIEAGADSSDAGQDACVANTGTGAIGTLGCPCSTTGEAACNGNAQKLALLCSGGVWVPDGTCPSGQLCDSQFGSNQGTCQPIDPLCASASPGQDVCATSTSSVQCGPDLVSHVPVATCVNQACVSGGCTGVCTPGVTQCTSNTQLQTCGANGQWATSTCPDACVGSTCGGVCVPTSTQTCSYWDPGCGCGVGGHQTCGSNGQWGGCG